MPLVQGCRHELEVTVPAETVEQETERVVTKIRNRARIPGFRPGKAPTSMVRVRFAEEIRREVIDTLIPRHLFEQLETEGLRPVGDPSVSDVSLEPGAPLSFKAEFEVLPQFELKEYRGLRVEYHEQEASEEEITEALERIREKHAVYRNLDPRPLADGDTAVLRLASVEAPPGVGPIQRDEVHATMGGSDTLPEFSAALRGLSPGEGARLEVNYPKDYSEPKLAGQRVVYQADVLGLRSKELPELNDELAKDEGDFQNLEELRERVRAEIELAKRQEAQREAKSKLVDALVDTHDFPLPEGLVERQTNANIERGLRVMAQHGIDVAGLKMDWNKLQETEQPRTIREIKAGLILDRIAAEEHIRATSEEVDRQVQLYARQNSQPVAAARAKLAEQGALNRMGAQIRYDKTLQFLFEQARKE